MTRFLTLILACVIVLGLAPAASAQTISRPIESPHTGRDIVLLRFRAAGRGDPRGKSLAVIDADARPVAVRVLLHEPEGETVIAIDSRDAKAPLTLQLGPKASGNARYNNDIPASLLLTTYPASGAARDLAQLANIISTTPPQGVASVERINLAFNPFGKPRNFVSLFEGILRLERSETLRLFTANHDAAFVEIDGKIVINRPEPHVPRDIEAAAGEAVGVELSEGEHRIRYLHAVGDSHPIAQLGVARGNHGEPAPASLFVHHPWARLGPATADNNKPAVGFDAQVVDQIVLEDQIYTRVVFRPISPAPEGTRYRWSFGDGSIADNAELSSDAGKAEPARGFAARSKRRAARADRIRDAELAQASAEPEGWLRSSLAGLEHVYLGASEPVRVTLELVDAKTASLGQASSTVRFPLLPEVPQASIEDKHAMARYAHAINLADYGRSAPELMAGLYSLLAVSEEPALMAPLAEQFVKRSGGKPGVIGWEMRYTLATWLARDEPERAEKLFGDLAAAAPSPWQSTCAAAEQFDLLILRLGKVDDIERRIFQIASGRQPRERALLRARIGDFHRLYGRIDKALEAYRDAQKDGQRNLDAKQAAVLERAHRETALSLLEQRRYPALRDELLQWEADFPMSKLGGDLPLLSARYFQAIGDDPRVVLELKSLLDLNPLHPGKPEILHRLSESLANLGKADEAKKLAQQLVKEFPNSPFARETQY